MIGPSARLFAWVQGAEFYVELHRDAVALVPRTHGRWLDIGCGPGLVARLAADAGFDAVGIDHDGDMVRLARHRSTGPAAPRFEVGDLNTLVPRSADVVSATSLLAVLPDPHEGVHRLWDTLRPGGTLLVVETTALMTPSQARAIAGRLPGHCGAALLLWSHARRGRTVDVELATQLGAATATTTPLLSGLVTATVITKSPVTGEAPRRDPACADRSGEPASFGVADQ